MFLDIINPSADLAYAVPMMILLGLGLLLMLLDAFDYKAALPYVTGGGFVLSSLVAVNDAFNLEYAFRFSNSIAFGGIASLVHILLCVAGAFSLFFIQDFLDRHKKDVGETYSLIVFATIGMIMLATANDLMLVFIGIEIMSVCLYIMAGLFPKNLKSNEAGLKYFLLGAFATGFLLYGIAMVYGLSGMDAKGPSTKLDVLSKIIPGLLTDTGTTAMFYVSLGLMLIGFSFKIAAFPFHSWTPDVYTGAPTPLAGFMATGSKMAAFIALAFLMHQINPTGHSKAFDFLVVLSVMSMLYGNIVAVLQTNVKRMLAYSSIAHTGYVLLGICGGNTGHMAVIFYMLIYTIMTVGAFGVVSILENNDNDAELSRWKGIGLKYPVLGVTMSTFLFSLTGMPPLAGFMGKYYVFESAINNELYIPCIIGILTSVVGAYYYLRVIVVMYFQKEDENTISQPSIPMIPAIGVITLMVVLIVLGAFPSLVQSVLDTLYSGAGLMTGK